MFRKSLVAAFVLACPLLAAAQAGSAAPPAAGPASAAAPMTEGVVRKVDKAAGKLTLRHGPIANLEMPAMTMVFHVATPAMLDAVHAGDAVRFRADRVDGALTVTAIEPVR